MILTQEFINALLDWQEQGRRSVKIEIEEKSMRIFKDRPVRVFCYDYDLMEGDTAKSIEGIPSSEYLKKKSMESKRAELEKLEKRLEDMRYAV